jgi:hypothetical protein
LDSVGFNGPFSLKTAEFRSISPFTEAEKNIPEKIVKSSEESRKSRIS